MISVDRMATKVAAALAKRKRSTAYWKGRALAATKRNEKLRAALGRARKAEKEQRRALREFQRRQMRLPL